MRTTPLFALALLTLSLFALHCDSSSQALNSHDVPPVNSNTTRDPNDPSSDSVSDASPDHAAEAGTVVQDVSSTCAPAAAEGPINLLYARAVGSCSGDTATCETLTYHLAAWIDLANLAYSKSVTLVYRARPSDPWSSATAHYFGPNASGRETWYVETAAVDLPSESAAAFEFSLRYEVSGTTATDDNGGALYALSVQGAGARSALLGASPLVLSSAFLDPSGALVGTAMVRAPQVGSLAVTYTVDDWAHTLNAPGNFERAIAGCDDASLWSFRVPLAAPYDKVSFAVSHAVGSDVAWDNNFSRNYARYASLFGFGGRWDLTVSSSARTFPSWFEIANDHGELTGRLVGRVGSVRPIRDLDITSGKLTLGVPVQYETQTGDLTFTANLNGENLSGSCTSDDGPATFTAAAAPDLTTSPPPSWGDPVTWLPGAGLDGWTARDASAPNGWQLQSGTLVNTSPGTDLVSTALLGDFQLHFEFILPPSGNSGVFLRGRYEVQLTDDTELLPSTLRVGAIYGFLTPTKNAGLPSGQWQSCDVTLVGRRVTVVLNGVTVIDAQEIPGITGGALDSNEMSPGPIVLQGDHTDVSFRNITVRTPH